MMKKIALGITTVIMMVILCMTMTACSSIEGTYKLESVKMTAPGVTIDVKAGEAYNGVTINADAVVLTMNKDKTFTLKAALMDTNMDQEGTWEQKDGKYYLTMEENGVEEIQEATLNGNKLILKASESGMEIEMVLKK